MTLPTHNAIQFSSVEEHQAALYDARLFEEHQAALYDACLFIVNTYNQTDLLDFYEYDGVSPYSFMKFARNVLNQLADVTP